MNILLFGDSLFGRFNRNLITQLETTIPDSTVYNGAAGGWTSSDGAKRSKFMASLESDYVLLSFGANDTAPWKEEVSKDDFVTNMRTILESFSKAKCVVLLCPDVQVESEEQTKEFNQRLADYNEASSELCESYSASIIDANELFKNLDDYHMEDGVHINQAGYDLIIEQLARILKP